MANLPETDGSTWPGLIQIENGWGQSGGPWDEGSRRGLWNAHGTALVERTNNLKARLDVTNQRVRSVNGYQVLPGGMIIQWGSASIGGDQTPVSFPIAFPNNCFSVVLCDRTDPNSPAGSIRIMGVQQYSLTTTGFIARLEVGTDGIFYQAIGY